jgi:hypothetical protein
MSEPHPEAEADLGSITDVEWLEGHEKLTEMVAGMPDFPDAELTFIWDPDLDPATLIDPSEVDHGPESDHA